MLSKREKDDYERAIIDIANNNIEDIDWLIGTLLYNRKKAKRELTAISFKICDIHNRVFPYYTINCNKCGYSSNNNSRKLRDFSIEPNYEKILDEYK